MSALIEIRVAEASNQVLDYLIDRIEYADQHTEEESIWGARVNILRYTTDWGRIGHIIAKRITCLVDDETCCYADTWAKAQCYGKPLEEFNGKGETMLIAACRAIVMSELGDTVKVPAELIREAA